MAQSDQTDIIVTTRSAAARIIVEVGSSVLADSANAVELIEDGYPPVLYLPQADIDMGRLTKSETKTLCPHKGIAEYWTYRDDAKVIEDIAWMYPTPVSTVGDIAGHLAFYPDKIDAIKQQ